MIVKYPLGILPSHIQFTFSTSTSVILFNFCEGISITFAFLIIPISLGNVPLLSSIQSTKSSVGNKSGKDIILQLIFSFNKSEANSFAYFSPALSLSFNITALSTFISFNHLAQEGSTLLPLGEQVAFHPVNAMKWSTHFSPSNIKTVFSLRKVSNL